MAQNQSMDFPKESIESLYFETDVSEHNKSMKHSDTKVAAVAVPLCVALCF